MNEREYLKWQDDARAALSRIYTESEVETVLAWFRSIKGADERELVGDKAVDSMDLIYEAWDSFSLYHSLMARLWFYAPLILSTK